jgi:O-acetyl-ADP-ribose deacetylase (regulator of RNase III)
MEQITHQYADLWAILYLRWRSYYISIMKFILIDKNTAVVEAWKKAFANENNVEVLEGDLTAQKVDAIVSPANSFGFMDGGVDWAISDKLGWDLQDALQLQIKDLPEGELLVGKTLVLETGNADIPYLISAPTMRVPMSFNIHNSVNAYLAMKATLIAAIAHPNITTLAIPGFCTGAGRMLPETAAHQMFMAFEEIVNGKKPDFKEFGEAQKHHLKINPKGMIYDW